jgi:Bacterial self-protective colicin-like immunity
MSDGLLSFAKAFLSGKSDPEEFVEEFSIRWRQERDNGILLLDKPGVSSALSSIFCLIDMFNADDDRESYELDESGLRLEMEKLLLQEIG